MTVLKSLLSPIYLEDKEVRKVIELMFFSYRDFTAGPDKILEDLNFGRAHHRVIYFVGKREKITIKDLLSILQITKQSLSRVLNQLVSEKYIDVTIGKDKRTKDLTLTIKGADLEKQLSTIQINKIKNLIKDSNEKEVSNFKIMLYKMINKKNQIKFDEINN
mgnify:CR=1 FL=1|jgi:DNA-binding MarR family transcriptional regulator|tara:strand:- start:1405 stop:1890 length:486 start_codon:yes stop_codon:yes gene_type:complete